MGTWGIGFFDNDTASDYVARVMQSTDFSVLEATLDRVLCTIGYLESPDGEEALAAAHIVASLKKSPREHSASPAGLDDWVRMLGIAPQRSLFEKARRAVFRVLAEGSELRELWKESEKFDLWKADVQALAAQLESS